MPSHSGKKSIKSDYQNIIKRAKKQPGLNELMTVYGQYDDLLTQSQEYLGILQSTETFSVSATSA
jgi:hypothetical protein